jgi:hypothetical protein
MPCHFNKVDRLLRRTVSVYVSMFNTPVTFIRISFPKLEYRVIASGGVESS